MKSYENCINSSIGNVDSQYFDSAIIIIIEKTRGLLNIHTKGRKCDNDADLSRPFQRYMYVFIEKWSYANITGHSVCMACPSTQYCNMNRYLVSRHMLCLYNSEFLLQNLIGMLNKNARYILPAVNVHAHKTCKWIYCFI